MEISALIYPAYDIRNFAKSLQSVPSSTLVCCHPIRERSTSTVCAATCNSYDRSTWTIRFSMKLSGGGQRAAMDSSLCRPTWPWHLLQCSILFAANVKKENKCGNNLCSCRKHGLNVWKRARVATAGTVWTRKKNVKWILMMLRIQAPDRRTKKFTNNHTFKMWLNSSVPVSF